MGVDDRYWMQEAYALAIKAREHGEVPVGAVVIDEHNQLIGQGYNQVISLSDPTAHAEIMAMRMAATSVQNYRLNNVTLYVTLEPCCMCVGAMVHARIKRLVYATRDLRAGAAGSVFNFLQHPALNHGIYLDEGILQVECEALLKDFFKLRRKK